MYLCLTPNTLRLLVRIALLQHDAERLRQDLEIHPERPLAAVLVVAGAANIHLFERFRLTVMTLTGASSVIPGRTLYTQPPPPCGSPTPSRSRTLELFLP